MERGAPQVILALAFAAVVVCFIGSTLYAQVQANQIGALSESIAGNAMPSIEHLAAARSELRHVQALANRYPVARDRSGVLGEMVAAQDKIDVNVDAYLRLPVYPGEAEVWAAIRRALEDVDSAVAALRDAVDAGDLARATASVPRVDAACERAVAAVLEDIEFNARNGEQIARHIGEVRRSALAVALGLDAVSMILTVVVAVLVVRAISSQTRLLHRHNRMLAERADELEQFAGRVAHDVRNPIGAATLALSLLQRTGTASEKADVLVRRGLSSLARASRFVDGLLAFARAGARPGADARANVRAVLGALVEELQPEATEAGLELRAESLPDRDVRCDRGVLEVLASNLVRNAIKYMDDGPVRRIVVRAREVAGAVRVEVEDTGVGVLEEQRARIFEPFVRGTAVRGEGIGLGLATVKRICDTHGGRVGVDPAPVKGSVFWFELPEQAAAAAAPERHAG